MTSAVNALQHGRESLRRHARTFRVASWFLPQASRDDASLVYAYCRELDDAVDEAPNPEVARVRVQLVERGEVAEAFREVAARRGFAPGIAQHLVAGIQSDLGLVRIADDAALLRYCYQVAGTVGVMMCGILGVKEPCALPHAVDLGVGMQLTNICRDVLEDASLGRVYLPASRLHAVGLTQEELLAGTAEPASLSRLVEGLLVLADRYYRSADAGMPFIPARSRLAIVVASKLYRGIGVRLRRHHGSNPLHGRTRASFGDKLIGVCSALGFWFWMSLFWRPGSRPHERALHRHLAQFPGVSVD